MVIVQIIEYCRVVVTRNSEGFCGKGPAFFQSSRTFTSADDFQIVFVLFTRRNTDNIFEVFGCSSDQRNATDVYFFNDFLFRSSTCNCFFEGVQIDNYEVYFWDFKFLQLCLVTFVFSSV